MNIPELRFPEFNAYWTGKSLGELLEFKNGINASKEQYGRGFKFINVLDILNNDFITHDKIIGSVDVENSVIDKYPVNYGDILFQRSSETREEVGSASVYLDKEHTATFGGFVIRGRKIGDYDPVFLNLLLKTDSARDSITSRSGGSTRFNVGQETLSSVNLLFPEIYEQQKIATFFTTIDQKIHSLKKKKTLLEEYKKAVMQKIFSQEIRFKEDDGQDYPAWESKYLGDVSEIKKGEQLNKEELTESGTYPCLNGGVSYSGYTEKFNSNENTITISEGGNSCGFVNFLTTKFWLGGHCYKVQLDKEISQYYFYYLLKFNEQKIMNLRVGSGLPNIQQRDLRKFELVISKSNAEQTYIANFLSSLDAKINGVKVQIEKSEQWKKGLLQQMFC